MRMGSNDDENNGTTAVLFIPKKVLSSSPHPNLQVFWRFSKWYLRLEF